MANPFLKIQQTVSFLRTHEFSSRHSIKALRHYFTWQLRSKLTGKPMLFQWTPGARLWLGKGLTGASGNYYCGLHEFSDMMFLLHLLKPGDLFADVGANIGSYTVLASAESGAESISFEPVPESFNWLQQNIESNKITDRVTAVASAVGNQTGTTSFTNGFGAENQEIFSAATDSIRVRIDSLDNLLNGKVPALIKIDVEGGEARVLDGARKTIQSPAVQAMIIEMGNNSMPAEPGITTHDWVLSQGFYPYRYDPFTRSLHPVSTNNQHNTIYIRNKDWTVERIAAAAPVCLWGERL